MRWNSQPSALLAILALIPLCILPMPLAQQAASPPAAQAPPTPESPKTSPAPALLAPATAAAPSPAAQPRFLVVIDAAHGGSEWGAAFSPKLLEKDVTLAIARRLRRELENRGISVLMLRDSDATLSFDQRAALANAARPAAFIEIHAGTLGAGLRVYTCMVAAGKPSPAKTPPLFLPWARAQSAFLQASLRLASAVTTESENNEIATATLAAPLRPLSSVAAPAIALEVAPSGNDVQELASANYQQSIATAVSAGIHSARARLEQLR